MIDRLHFLCLVAVAAVCAGNTLPTTLPVDKTSIDYGSGEYTGTIPTEFGLLTNLVGALYLFDNELTGTVPSQLGLLGLLANSFHLVRSARISPTTQLNRHHHHQL
mmetsp:Transcript_77065/g.221385  ORF Transcript_77065/g.221385 Transcript_77065/m.221385 type:complete len:106 (-) Transcript_77065:966-1283(-)